MKKNHLKSSFAIRAALVAAAVAVHSAFADTPDELLEYVESTGTQYIDTGIVGKSGTKASMQMMWTKNESDKSFLAARKSSSERFFLLHRYNATHIFAGYWGKTSQIIEISENNVYSVITEVKTDGTYTVSANGTSKTLDTSGVGAKNTGYNLYLFAMNNAGSPAYHSSARCYGTKIWQVPDGGTDYALVRDFVPCKKNNTAGLWDRVTGNIFYPVTGTLTAGNTVAIHAEPDKELEYVEADGRQYIDTGVNARSGTKATAKLIYTESDVSVNDNYGGYVVLGAKGSSNTSYLYMIRRQYNGDNWRWMTCYGGRYQTLFEDMAKDQTYVLASEITTNGMCKATRNGGNVSERDYSDQTSNTPAVGALDTGVSFYALAANLNGSPGHYAKARLYSMTIEQTDSDGVYQSVRNFTPCKKDGRAGLYDSVSGMIFFGQGFDLIAPPDTEGVPDAFVEYVESDGTQYIDTEVIGRDGTKAEIDFKFNELGGSSIILLGADKSDPWTDNIKFYLLAYRSVNGTITDGYKNRYNQTFDATTDRCQVISEIMAGGTFKTTINGRTVTHDYTTDPGPYNSGLSLYLFTNNRNGTAGTLSAKARCYGLKIWQTDENGDYQLVRDFRPCIKGGIAGLYDDISKKIYYPAAGRLRAADKTFPAKFVEYVESDGTLYVDTCVKGKAGTKAEMTFNVNENNGNPSYLLSAYGNGVNMNFCYFGNSINVGFGNSTYNTYWSGYSKGTQYTLKSEYTLAQKVNASLNGNQASEKTATGGTNSGVNLYAFARNKAGLVDGGCSVKLYAMKILQADAVGTYSIVRDFKPCVATNGVAALYDKVSGTIYYPHGGLLATGGVERAVAATARWKGGAVTAEADLAVAANWDCFDANGNLVADTTPTAVTTVLVGQGSPLLALPAGIAVQDWAGITLTNSVTLSAACDWSPLGPMMLANGVTIDLAGYDLVSGGFALASGATASVANSGAAATLTFAVADGIAATMNGITFASNIMLAKTGGGKLTTVGSAWSSIVVSNGTLAVSAQSSTIGSVYLAKGTVLDLGGKTVTCGAFSGAGKVRNGTLIVTGTLSAVVGNPLMFTGVALDVSGAGVAIANPESITGRDPIVVATSDQSITGRARAAVFGWKVQVTQDGDVYKLELAPSCGFHLYIR